MKLPAFNNETRRWDAYSQFHIPGRIFTQFENGALGLRWGKFDPHERRYYESFGVSIAATTDDHLPTLYTPDGEEITKAWLNQDGQQTLIIDHEQKKAARGWKHSLPKDFPVPQYARGFHMFWHAPGQDPVMDPRSTIKVKRPDNELKAASRTWEKEVRAACRVLAKIDGEPQQYYYTPTKFGLSTMFLTMPVTEFLTQLTPAQVRDIALAGFEYPRAVSEYPYLVVKE
jgi:hypothetical protein